MLDWFIKQHEEFREISPLSTLTSLYQLNLGYNQIIDPAPRTNLINLAGLTLQRNAIIDVSELAKLTDLQALDLRANQIGGIGVGHIDSLDTLVNGYIQLDANPTMSCTELANLMTALGSSQVSPGRADNTKNCSDP